MKRDDMLDLNDALQHPGRKVAVDLSTELPDEADIDLIKPVEGFLEAISTGNMLLIHTELKTRLVVECARCGGPLEMDLEFTMDDEFPVEGTPSSYAADDYARVVPDEPYPLFDENNLLVENLVRQGLLLNLPLQPLCSFGWEGDCPLAKIRQAARQQESGRVELQRLATLLEDDEEKNR